MSAVTQVTRDQWHALRRSQPGPDEWDALFARYGRVAGVLLNRRATFDPIRKYFGHYTMRLAYKKRRALIEGAEK